MDNCIGAVFSWSGFPSCKMPSEIVFNGVLDGEGVAKCGGLWPPLIPRVSGT
jgi:hypothetical protein